MIDRYIDRRIVKNNSELYSDIFNDRNLNFIEHYTTPFFILPSIQQYKNLNSVKHVWKVGDRFYKLASQYYGDPKDWWVIAKFNNKPTESHVKIGDILYIPTPIHQALAAMKG